MGCTCYVTQTLIHDDRYNNGLLQTEAVLYSLRIANRDRLGHEEDYQEVIN
jgi:hypothetical protein